MGCWHLVRAARLRRRTSPLDSTRQTVYTEQFLFTLADLDADDEYVYAFFHLRVNRVVLEGFNMENGLIQSVGPVNNWRTTDQDEINRCRLRAAKETMRFRNLTPEYPVFSNFSVESASGQTYHVELRNLKPLVGSCTCVDFRVNGLGTCKHVEALLRSLRNDAACCGRRNARVRLASTSCRRLPRGDWPWNGTSIVCRPV